MEGVVNVEWHGQDYLHLKWQVVCSGLATPGVKYGYPGDKALLPFQFRLKFHKFLW